MERLKVESGREAKEEGHESKYIYIKRGDVYLINLMDDAERSILISFGAEAVAFRHSLFNSVYAMASGLPAADIQQRSICPDVEQAC
jgi:hypothetical protein